MLGEGGKKNTEDRDSNCHVVRESVTGLTWHAVPVLISEIQTLVGYGFAREKNPATGRSGALAATHVTDLRANPDSNKGRSLIQSQ